MALSLGDPGVQVALSAAVSRRLALHRRLRLVHSVSYGIPRAAISGQGVCSLPTRLFRRAGAHAVACHQGREAASIGRSARSLTANPAEVSTNATWALWRMVTDCRTFISCASHGVPSIRGGGLRADRCQWSG